MGLPSTPVLTTCRFVGTFYDASGEPDIGIITVTPTATLAVSGSPGYAIDSRPIVLDVTAVDGAAVPLGVDVVATDNTSVGPTGWGYTVTYRLRSRSDRMTTFAPGGTTVDLTEISGVASAAVGYTTVRTVAGLSPTPDGNIDLSGVGGVAGPPGPAGPIGPQGPAGPTGATGAQGTAGAAGSTGAQGPKGDTGNTGAAGADGAQGPQGIQGATGAAGAAGADGAPGAAAPYIAKMQGFVTWTGDPLNWTTRSGVGDGDVSLICLPVPAGEPIGRAWIAVGVAGTYLSTGKPNRLGVWDESGALLSLTADDSTLYTAAGWRSGALLTPVAAGAARNVFVGLIVGGMTSLQLLYPTSANLVGSVEGNVLNGGPITRRRAVYLTGQSTLPSSFDPTAVGTVTAYMPLVALSAT